MTVEAYKKKQQENRLAHLKWLHRNATEETCSAVRALWDRAHLGHDTADVTAHLDACLTNLGCVTDALAAEFGHTRAVRMPTFMRERTLEAALSNVKPLRDPETQRRLEAATLTARRP